MDVTDETRARTRARAPLFIVFEGIDGSGKTTVSNHVAERLRALGLGVTHVRAGGRLASDTAESIRQLARDPRHLALAPVAELLLYVAREAQQLEECVRPALAAGDVVIADRFFHTAEVLARFGRGLPAERVAPVLAAAAGGVAPDLTVLIDVDPHVARARRRADKLARPTVRTSSRKGLSGAGLMHRLRAGYRELAAATPERWLVVDNTTAELGALVDRLAAQLHALATGGARPRGVGATIPPLGGPAGPRDARGARAELLAWIDATAAREPEVAAYFLGGLAGDDIDARRRRLAPVAPAIIASGLGGQGGAASWALREALVAAAPAAVARSLGGLVATTPEAWALRRRLAPACPEAVALSLEGVPGAEAWALRQELWPRVPDAVMRSLAGDDAPAAWILRDLWLGGAGGEAALGDPEHARTLSHSLRGLGGTRAWALRKRCRAVSPVGALLSLAGLDDERAWRWRERWLERAPRPVLAGIAGLDDARAWALREAALPRAKEALDSIVGLDGERAWALRLAAADRWPSTVVKSLGELGAQGRGQELVERQLRRYPHDLSLLKHAAALAPAADARAAAAS